MAVLIIFPVINLIMLSIEGQGDSNRQPKISDKRDYDCSQFHFCSKLPKTGVLQPQNLHLKPKFFNKKRIFSFFSQPKI